MKITELLRTLREHGLRINKKEEKYLFKYWGENIPNNLKIEYIVGKSLEVMLNADNSDFKEK